MQSYEYYEEKRQKTWKKLRFWGEHIAGMEFAGTRLLSGKEGNDKIKDLLLSGKPVTISRFGKTEMDPVTYRELGRTDPALKESVDREIGNCSGFFPCTSDMIDRYREVLIESISDIDFMGIWFFIENEEYMIDKYMNKPICALPKSLDPEYYKHPWSYALKGKKVLVINPFVDTIRHQYENYREHIYKNPEMLPEYELKTLKAVQTLADERDPRFSNWFEALDWMKEEIEKIDFDIALLGCGAYGIPLQHHIKSLGKSSVYIGGGAQVMYGITGRRWDNNKYVNKWKNEYWTRPGQHEQIASYKKVEMGGPYW